MYSRPKIPIKKLIFCFFTSLAVTWVQAACPSITGRFIANGTDVTDNRTGLIWARCSVGQSWNGSICSGTAITYTHEQALSYVKSQSGWRLPNVKEISSLTDKGCSNPAIDSTLFSNTMPNRYWSSSPYTVNDSSLSWSVYFFDGGVNISNRNLYQYVRLVR